MRATGATLCTDFAKVRKCTKVPDFMFFSVGIAASESMMESISQGGSYQPIFHLRRGGNEQMTDLRCFFKKTLAGSSEKTRNSQ
jgi:hypothetical protein